MNGCVLAGVCCWPSDPALTGRLRSAAGRSAPTGRQRADPAGGPKRWGWRSALTKEQPLARDCCAFRGRQNAVGIAGRITIADPAKADCVLAGAGCHRSCRVGRGRVTLIADAAVFEQCRTGWAEGRGSGCAAGRCFRSGPVRRNHGIAGLGAGRSGGETAGKSGNAGPNPALWGIRPRRISLAGRLLPKKKNSY